MWTSCSPTSAPIGCDRRRCIGARDRRGGGLAGERRPLGGLLLRAWELRANVSFYDALYVALAEAQGLALRTADARLAAADGPRCPIQVV